MTRPTLHGTPLSHFTRKVRIVLAELGVAHDMVWLTGLLATSPASYADNPLLRVPSLVTDGALLIDSDHIARVVVREHDPADRLGVRSDRPALLNQLAVTNGIMANEVVLILARRGGLVDLDGVVYFRKLKDSIARGLDWLDRAVEVERLELDYADIALVCMWQHLAHYQLVDLDGRDRIAARVTRFAARPSIAATAPEAALAEARAAGWAPG